MTPDCCHHIVADHADAPIRSAALTNGIPEQTSAKN
jgi:hypothetical protein